MKICMFTNTYLPHVGGVARSVSFFAEDLRKLGNDVLIIAPTFSDHEIAQGNDPDVVRVPAIQNFNGSDFSVRIPIPFMIDEKIDEFNPDIVHSHHPFLLGDAAIRAAYRRNLPLVYTHHTLYEQYTHYVSADSDIMKQLAIHLSTEYANLCTRVVSPSESIASLIKKRGVTIPIEVIPTGVDVNHFSSGDGKFFRKQHSIPEGKVVLGHLGRLAPEKNLEYLCQSVLGALKREPGLFSFLVVGSGPSASRIQELFTKEGVSEALVMTGKMEGDDLVNSYSAMDLFLFSSKSETQGMVLAEAMAASLPVIALDASGVREVVEDKINGRLLEEDASVEIFTDTICQSASDKKIRKEWSQKAFTTAKKFSRENTAGKMAALYRDMVEQPNGSAKVNKISLEPLEELLQSFKIEWDLLSEKASALISSIQHQPDNN